MVLATNEWLNNGEDEQKAPSSASSTSTNDSINSATIATSTTSSTATDSDENNIETETDVITATDKSNQIRHHQLRNQIEESMMNSTGDILKIMADNATNNSLDNSDAANTTVTVSSATNNTVTSTSTVSMESATGTDSGFNNDGAVTGTGSMNPEEIENNNRAFEAFLAASFSEMDTSDSNTNILINNISSHTTTGGRWAPNRKSPPSVVDSTMTPSTNSVSSSHTINNGDEPTILSSLGLTINANNTTNGSLNGPQPPPPPPSNTGNMKQLQATGFANSSSSLDNISVSSSSTNSNTIEGNESPVELGQPKIILLCEPNSHPFQTRTISLTPNVECKVGRLIAKCKAAENNAIFDCKVLSRNHAVLWYSDDGKFWVKDTKSSNGTFINDNKLGVEAAELHYGDIVKFGVDVLENSRKEVHGCIIACVRLYMPDGREAMSTAMNSQLSQYFGESGISHDDLHRLNVFVQEASQREKMLQSKLCNLQNVLDATRKSAAGCWQSMITEDQLLHHIQTLERKIQIMEKNVPENVLKAEVVKLLEEKNAYQHLAKEALRKVYQERCDALQKLSKAESDLATSDNECKILNEQICRMQQTLDDTNSLIRRMEVDFSDLREEGERQQSEAKTQADQQIEELTSKLHASETECESLRNRISDLLSKHSELMETGEDQLQKQALEKLDAAIGDMDLGDDDDDDDEEDDEDDIVNENIIGRFKTSKLNESNSSGKQKPLDSKRPKRVTNQTVMKWLQNSDLNKKEGSMDIFKAICESDSSDELDVISPGAGTNNLTKFTNQHYDDFLQRCTKFTSILKDVENNLTVLQSETEQYAENDNSSSGLEDQLNNADSGVILNKDADVKENNDESNSKDKDNDKDNDKNKKVVKDNKSCDLLRNTIKMLYEAHMEIKENVKCLQELAHNKSQAQKSQLGNKSHKQQLDGGSTETSSSLRTLPEIQEDEEHDDADNSDEEDNSGDDIESGEKEITRQTITISSETQKSHQAEITRYKEIIAKLESKLQANDDEQKNILDMLQTECEVYKEKTTLLKSCNEKLTKEKENLEELLKSLESIKAVKKVSEETDVKKQQPISSVDASTETSSLSESGVKMLSDSLCSASSIKSENTDTDPFEQQIREEMAAINSSTVQREEELIVYKERLEQTQQENVKLRDEMLVLKRKGSLPLGFLNKQTAIPIVGAVLLSALIYFILSH